MVPAFSDPLPSGDTSAGRFKALHKGHKKALQRPTRKGMRGKGARRGRKIN